MGKAEEFGFFLTRTFATTRNTRKKWPFIPGKYFVHDPTAPVAVTTLGSVDLAKAVSDLKPDGLCIVGKVETENIGIEKIIKNVLSNKAIHYLVCAGAEPPKHLTGQTMVSLFEKGIDYSIKKGWIEKTYRERMDLTNCGGWRYPTHRPQKGLVES
ncbi:MAG: hypothetical protein ACO3MW_15640 [Rhodospirillales bacterium]